MIDENNKHFKKIASAAMIQYFAAMPDIDISALLTRISVPTLVVTGDRDPIVPPIQSHMIAKKVASAELVVLKEVGHFPFLENPTGYQSAIDNWLYRHCG